MTKLHRLCLRQQLVASAVLALLLTLGLSAGLAALRAARSVRTELGSAMAVGQQVIRNGLQELAQSPQPEIDTAGLMATFNGNRHLRVLLLNAAGRLVAQSQPSLGDPPVPGWFLWLVRPDLPAERTAIPPGLGGGTIVLDPEPANEAGEVWVALGNEAMELAAFCLLTSLLVYGVTGRALRPLTRLSAAFGRIGAGDYAARVPPEGPAEIARLAGGFNRMAEQLASVSAQNRRLQEQLLILQDEERADLARDLHDEIGPFLFSVSITAASIAHLAAEGRAAEIGAEATAIGEAVSHMQKHVRMLLAQLRPLRAAELGLAHSAASLVAFWSSRYPRTEFITDLPARLSGLPDSVQEVIYRVMQESLSNAVRHAAPRRVEITAAVEANLAVLRVRDDGAAPAEAAGAGFGIAGMRERVASLGGTLEAGPLPLRGGWEVVARLPCADCAAVGAA